MGALARCVHILRSSAFWPTGYIMVSMIYIILLLLLLMLLLFSYLPRHTGPALQLRYVTSFYDFAQGTVRQSAFLSWCDDSWEDQEASGGLAE